MKPTLEQRFWSKVDRRGPHECWPWKGEITHKGYGRFRVGKKNLAAHRLARELTGNPIPHGLVARHTCHVRACVNPNHILHGTHQDNMDDMVNAGHSTRGTRNASAKLQDLDIRIIRLAAKNGSPRTTIAAAFDIHPSTVSKITTRKKWGWLD